MQVRHMFQKSWSKNQNTDRISAPHKAYNLKIVYPPYPHNSVGFYDLTETDSAVAKWARRFIHISTANILQLKTFFPIIEYLNLYIIWAFPFLNIPKALDPSYALR